MFELEVVKRAWPVWRPQIEQFIYSTSSATPISVMELGRNLADIFRSTSEKSRTQVQLSNAGRAWECLVCWYLNLCLLNTRCVVVRSRKQRPSPIHDALTITYGSVATNTESDLVAITYPEETQNEMGCFNFEGDQKRLNEICERNFGQIEVCVVQCKTNWNDNAQIPMLWDLAYSSKGFDAKASIGRNGWSIKSLRRFAYAFVTVPSNSKVLYRPSTMPVLRVKALSGGNYWGLPSKTDVALNIGEILHKNFSSALESCPSGWHAAQVQGYKNLAEDHPYFRLS